MLLLIPNSLKCRYVPILKRGITFKLYDHSPAILEYEIRIKKIMGLTCLNCCLKQV